MENEVIETRTSRFWLGKDGIVRNIVLTQAVVTLNDAKENIATQLKITGERKSPIFVDLRKINSINSEARRYFSSKDAKAIISAIGMLFNSPVSRVIGNLYIGINKPDIPTKVFTSENKAIEWLKGFVEKNNKEDAH